MARSKPKPPRLPRRKEKRELSPTNPFERLLRAQVKEMHRAIRLSKAAEAAEMSEKADKKKKGSKGDLDARKSAGKKVSTPPKRQKATTSPKAAAIGIAKAAPKRKSAAKEPKTSKASTSAGEGKVTGRSAKAMEKEGRKTRKEKLVPSAEIPIKSSKAKRDIDEKGAAPGTNDAIGITMDHFMTHAPPLKLKLESAFGPGQSPPVIALHPQQVTPACFGWQASDLLLEVELEDEARVKCSIKVEITVKNAMPPAGADTKATNETASNAPVPRPGSVHSDGDQANHATLGPDAVTHPTETHNPPQAESDLSRGQQPRALSSLSPCSSLPTPAEDEDDDDDDIASEAGTASKTASPADDIDHSRDIPALAEHVNNAVPFAEIVDELNSWPDRDLAMATYVDHLLYDPDVEAQMATYVDNLMHDPEVEAQMATYVDNLMNNPEVEAQMAACLGAAYEAL